MSLEAGGLGNPRQLKCRPGVVRTARGCVRNIDHRARGVLPVSDTGNGEFDSHMVNWWACATRVQDNKAGRQVVAEFAVLVDVAAALLIYVGRESYGSIPSRSFYGRWCNRGARRSTYILLAL